MGEPDLRVVAFYDSDDRPEEADREIEHGRIRGGIARLMEDVQRGEVEEVIVAMPWSMEKRIREILRSLATLSINVRICPDVFTLFLPMRSMTSVAGVSFLDVFVRPISGWDLVLKNLEDRILAPIFCLIFLIPCLIIALGNQARQPRAGAVQADALRLQQQPHQRAEIPQHVYRPAGRNRACPRQPATIRALPGWGASCAAAAWTSCRSSGTC